MAEPEAVGEAAAPKIRFLLIIWLGIALLNRGCSDSESHRDADVHADSRAP